MPLFPILLRWKAEKYSTKKEFTETFDSYFVNVGPSLAVSIPENKTSFQNYIYNDGIINLTGLGLENVSASLKTNKSSGYDDISADVVKRVSDEIFVILKHIFNISLAKGVFPDKLRIARVTSIFKKKNSTLVTNYRPVSVLPCFSKLLEPIITRHFLKSNLGFNMRSQQDMLVC